MSKTILEILDAAEDGQEDSEPVALRMTAGQMRYLRLLVDDNSKPTLAATLAAQQS